MIIAQVFLFIASSMLLVAEYEGGPDDCIHNNKSYPIYSKWASTIPLDCAEYTCHNKQRITKKECEPESPLPPPTPGVTCYPVNKSENYFPYCCPKHRCINSTDPSQKENFILPVKDDADVDEDDSVDV